jgi:hypothetical protein
MANFRFPAASHTSWVLRIENWPLKIGYCARAEDSLPAPVPTGGGDDF